MKVFGLMSLLIILSSCATNQEKAVIENANTNPVKSYEQKKELIKEIISTHNEFNLATKEKLEKSLLASLDRAQNLKDKESQLIQEVLKQSIVKKASYENLVVLKKELKNLYKEKYKNFETAINDLKQIVGIKPENQGFYDDLSLGDFLSGRDRQ